MKSYAAQILFVGFPANFAASLPSAETPHISWTIIERNTARPEDLAAADIVISVGSLPSDMLSMLSPHARTVFCLSSDAEIPAESEKCDIWLYPCPPAFFTARFKRLLELFDVQEHARFMDSVFEASTEKVPDFIWVKDLAGRHYYTNTSFRRAMGKENAEVFGRTMSEICGSAENSRNSAQTDFAVISEKTTKKFEEVLLLADGTKHMYDTYKSPIQDKTGKIIGTVGVAHDITGFENLGHEMKLLLDAIPFGVLLVDRNDTIISCNEGISHLFGTEQSEILNSGYKEFLKSRLLAPRDAQYSSGYDADVLLHGDSLVYNYLERPIKDVFDAEIGKFFICHNVTAARHHEEALRGDMYTDVLTGLKNRRYLRDLLDGPLSPVRAVLFFDVDDFKHINDTLGHQYGDFILRRVGAVLNESFPHDACIRFGGDEFIVCVFRDVDRGELELMLQTVHLQTRHICDDQMCLMQPLSLSAGVAIEGVDGRSLSSLLKAADTTMYSMKKLKKCMGE